MKRVNCKHCKDYINEECLGINNCICYNCPRNLGQCILIKYCRETESVLTIGSSDYIGD